MSITIDFKDIARMMKTGESFRLYSAKIEATDPDRINLLWKQINDQIDLHGAPASTCCFVLYAGEPLAITMDELTELCDLIQKVYVNGDIIWGYDVSSEDNLVCMEFIG